MSNVPVLWVFVDLISPSTGASVGSQTPVKSCCEKHPKLLTRYLGNIWADLLYVGRQLATTLNFFRWGKCSRIDFCVLANMQTRELRLLRTCCGSLRNHSRLNPSIEGPSIPTESGNQLVRKYHQGFEFVRRD